MESLGASEILKCLGLLDEGLALRGRDVGIGDLGPVSLSCGERCVGLSGFRVYHILEARTTLKSSLNHPCGGLYLETLGALVIRVQRFRV